MVTRCPRCYVRLRSNIEAMIHKCPEASPPRTPRASRARRTTTRARTAPQAGQRTYVDPATGKRLLVDDDGTPIPRGYSYNRTTPAELELAAKLRSQGLTWRQVGERIGKDFGGLRIACKKAGLV